MILKQKSYIILLSATLFCIVGLNAQIAPDTYWVHFSDKDNSQYSLSNPEEFLSERALIRRLKQNIKVDESDLPVNKVYIDSLKHLGLYIHNTSKWLNGAAIISTDTALLDTLIKLNFVESITPRKSISKLKTTYTKRHLPPLIDEQTTSDNQLEMLQLNAFHAKGYRGNNIRIAILDAGFRNADKIESVNHIWDENRMITYRDFVKDGENILENNSHGTMVFSIIAANLENNLMGAAPAAEFLLIRTERSADEYLVEEYNWISGAEYADSLGADIINSSLGYSVFSDTSQNHSYEDMNGKTTPVTTGALMAARKGMLVVTSAGNEGNKNWRYITAPADADSVLTIGAVDGAGSLAAFSSRGPTADGRIKPEVVAQGVQTAGQINPGSTTSGNGTSFSAPLISGFAACLWQAYPMASAQEIRSTIIKSSHLYLEPDNNLGHGIPNALIAVDSIKEKEKLTELMLYPNPTVATINLRLELPWLEKHTEGILFISDLAGKTLQSYSYGFSPGPNYKNLNKVDQLGAGYYLIRILVDGRLYQAPFIKTD